MELSRYLSYQLPAEAWPCSEDALKHMWGIWSRGPDGMVGREIHPIRGGPAPQLPSFNNLEAIHRDISRPHHRYRATHFTSSSIRRQANSIPISPHTSAPSLSTATSTTLVPPLGFPDLSESHFWRPRKVAGESRRLPTSPIAACWERSRTADLRRSVRWPWS